MIAELLIAKRMDGSAGIPYGHGPCARHEKDVPHGAYSHAELWIKWDKLCLFAISGNGHMYAKKKKGWE
jgi:hypothetical protein